MAHSGTGFRTDASSLARWRPPGLKAGALAAVRSARRRGAVTLLSVTGDLGPDIDPTAIVTASRGRNEPWFCFEQPDRDGSALGALGVVQTIEAAGPDRFDRVAERWDAVVADAVSAGEDGPPGSGLVGVGGFAFAPEGAASPAWEGFAPGSLIVPELSLMRREAGTWLTFNATVAPDDTAEDVLVRFARRLGSLRSSPLPLLDPAPTGRFEVSSPLAPSHFEAAVARAVERIRAGELEKLVLAREVEVHAPTAHDPAAVLGVLREAYASSFVFAVGRGDATFVGATPELLVRREGQRATTVALAGSTRRSADPAVDDHLGEALLRSEKDREENAIVARRIARTLRPVSVWVAAAPEPVVVRVANIQHLACPIRAQLAAPMGAVELAGRLHPTPAVGAEPAGALPLIPALEGLDRGWYAGPVGWTDGGGDGEFCVALRSALLRGRVARCYAGCGIVADSEPAAELAESELKLGVMLPALVG
jgi:salicylate biosynthesis isochorismate synthase/menaquinone-specific isochorismate synthase